MTREAFTRWTCNLCQVVKETVGTAQPARWVGYGFTQPDVPAGAHVTLGHLCGQCHTRVTRGMES